MTDVVSLMRYADIKGIATKLGMSVEKYIELRKCGKKRCHICEKWKCEKYFKKDSSKTDCLSSRCRECDKSKDYKYFHTIRGKYISYRKEASRRNIIFSLSMDEFKNFWQLPCKYCGDEIKTVGLDRIDSNLGYSTENCVPCCIVCNAMKSNLSEIQWISHIRKILSNMGHIDLEAMR